MPELNWIGKAAVVKHHTQVPFRLLEPDAKLSCGDPDSGNLIVEGDNLLALKALLPRYAGKVKCIYIDPPYNTGNEGWVYNDNVKAPEIVKWLGETVGKEAEDLTRHDKWLCMMYPRLVLLKQFLAEDGAILISIDDNEIATLRLLLDEIFGQQQHIASFIWNSSGHTDNQLEVKVNHEYVVCYARNRKKLKVCPKIDPNTREESNLWDNRAENSITKNGPGNPPSEILLPAGFPSEETTLNIASDSIPADLEKWMLEKKPTSSAIKMKYHGITFPLKRDDLIVEQNKVKDSCRVFSGWANARKLKLFIDNNFEPIIEDDGSLTRFYIKGKGVIYYEKEKPNAHNVMSVLRNFGTTEKMRSELAEMGIHFSYPKPLQLIQHVVGIFSDKNSVVMDSFAGSGTTAHSILKCNKAHGGSQKFILCQMPYESEQQRRNDENIARDRTAERVRRVIEGYTDSKGKTVKGLGGGFQYCRLSNEPLFDGYGAIRDDVRFGQLAEFVWFVETGTGYTAPKKQSPLLGIHDGRAIYLLYNGILQDRSDLGGNVLNQRTLAYLESDFPHDGPKAIYGARSRYQPARLKAAGVEFKQLPYRIQY